MIAKLAHDGGNMYQAMFVLNFAGKVRHSVELAQKKFNALNPKGDPELFLRLVDAFAATIEEGSAYSSPSPGVREKQLEPTQASEKKLQDQPVGSATV